ncbi:hypothetical protein E6O75_ATG09996 [Venturia nashicola]|uniref:Uncharacterized protein n=1 Tax=Venturia nashicola TaxID=86259 RepID=A0A4Z1P0E9_9PEZI|nr:hypothetical protein E6O75_ATG09996 [Venturia nashicola]
MASQSYYAGGQQQQYPPQAYGPPGGQYPPQQYGQPQYGQPQYPPQQVRAPSIGSAKQLDNSALDMELLGFAQPVSMPF